ncbi:hypothetical protein AAG906_030662 [Vitis piasezkii]
MWRLKVADGGNDPYIYTTNNFVGRQIWEFDPDYGTPEERAEVEAARENFWKNRFQVKPSSDLLWRMQLLFSGLHANLINWEKKHVLKPLDFKHDVHLPPNEVMIS